MAAPNLEARVNQMLEADDARGAFTALEEAWAEGGGRDVALLYAALLQRAPGRGSLVAEARQILTRFPTDPEVVIATNAALIAAAERRPRDEPVLRDDGPAELAAEAAARCIEALPADLAEDKVIAGYLHVNLANALRLSRPDRDAEAVAAFQRAIAIDPSNGSFLFDFGLLHKWRGRFREALDVNLRARARLGETRAVQWNVALCATAVGDGDLAAGVFKQLGFDAQLQESGMPFVDGMPPMQVRVISRGAGIGPASSFPDRAAGFEVVWVAPLSPCHGVVQSPTFRDTPVDYGDVVLWDGAPVGFLEQPDGTRVPRFPLLEILRRGDEKRLRFVALTAEPDDLAPLEEVLPEGCLVFRQRERIESARPANDDGTSLVKERQDRAVDQHLAHGKLIVPASIPMRDIAAAIESLRSPRLTISVLGIYEALGDTKREGQAHQAFLGIERRADKRHAN